MLLARKPLVSVAALLFSSMALAACSPDADPKADPSDGRPESSGTASSDPTPSQPPKPSPSRPNAAQTARLTVHPQLVHPGTEAAPATEALTAMTASFSPARPGREVELQQRRSAGWETVQTAKQGKRGTVQLSAPYRAGGRPGVYRVAAPADDELRREVSNQIRADRWGTPTFSEEFEGNALGASWSHRLQGYSLASSRACSKADPRATRVSGGLVRLSVLADPDRRGERCSTEDGSHEYRLNGHISTENSRAFTYGTFAARIKFQQLRGQHGAFWMQPQSQLAAEGDPSLTGAEIDVIEWFGEGQAQGGLTSFVYYRPDADGEKVGGFLRDPDQYGTQWGKRFHVFSVDWSPEGYVFRIDGQETFRTTEGVSGRPQFLILSLLSSDYELPFIRSEALPQHMYVDWVRHWRAP